MVPVISVVGRSDAGKTTLLEKLIGELSGRGYRVAVIKHHAHGDFDLDVPGKDSWRLSHAGSAVVAIASPTKLALIRQLDKEWSLGEIAALVPDADIVLTEGYKGGTAPKIEVSRRAVSRELLCSPNELVAIAADHLFDLDVPQFDLDDAVGLADLLEARFLVQRPGDSLTLLVDGRPVAIWKEFAEAIIKRTVRAMVSTLQGTEAARRIVLIVESDDSPP